MQRTERLPLLFPRTLGGVAVGKERGIGLRFLSFSCFLLYGWPWAGVPVAGSNERF
jgi:hypothetical protein